MSFGGTAIGNPAFFFKDEFFPQFREAQGAFNPVRLFVQGPAQPAPVPEPATILLFGTGAAAISRSAWKRRRTLTRHDRG